MYVKRLLIFCTAFIACSALPTPEETDLSIFFEHADPNARIVGGTEAAPGSHPHMVFLTSGRIRSFICGGSLVSTRTVLTAGHCVAGVYAGGILHINLRVTVGTNEWNSGGTEYTVARNITHPDFSLIYLKNDIGLLITDEEVKLSDAVRPIKLSYDFVSSGVPVRVAGWGRIGHREPLSEKLLVIDVRTIDGEACVRAAAQAAIDFNTWAPHVDPAIELCTFHAKGTGACGGDSGGALTRIDNGLQVGMVSWGFSCARGAPDMFVRISAFRSWLEENIV
ncbi:chymotrypsin-2 [Bombyx mori]|uniref:Peptidase S1 domain-containing protein n=1 Tax=Bombyx mori TaxID=7091 RepID=A0A8R2AI78_BOMMO|nr:chymotrypsin-2 [Bombyx mori]